MLMTLFITYGHAGFITDSIFTERYSFLNPLAKTTGTNTITVHENVTIEGLEDFTSWDIKHLFGINVLIRTQSKITFGNCRTA